MVEDAQLTNDEFRKEIIQVTYSYGNGFRTRRQECLFLTEDSLYEVLMQSQKPIAKRFKLEVKAILNRSERLVVIFRLLQKKYVYT